MTTCQNCERDVEMIWLKGEQLCPVCQHVQEPLPTGIYVLGAICLLVGVLICCAVWGNGVWVFAR